MPARPAFAHFKSRISNLEFQKNIVSPTQRLPRTRKTPTGNTIQGQPRTRTVNAGCSNLHLQRPISLAG